MKAALKNCGFDYPGHQAVTVNLAPADMRKEGSAFDLPMALGLLGCQETFFGKALADYVFLGELSLDGSVRSVRGALSAAIAAREQGIRNVIVPGANAKEAAVVDGIRVFAVKSLPQATDLIKAPRDGNPKARALRARPRPHPESGAHHPRPGPCTFHPATAFERSHPLSNARPNVLGVVVLLPMSLVSRIELP